MDITTQAQRQENFVISVIQLSGRWQQSIRKTLSSLGHIQIQSLQAQSCCFSDSSNRKWLWPHLWPAPLCTPHHWSIFNILTFPFTLSSVHSQSPLTQGSRQGLALSWAGNTLSHSIRISLLCITPDITNVPTRAVSPDRKSEWQLLWFGVLDCEKQLHRVCAAMNDLTFLCLHL